MSGEFIAERTEVLKGRHDGDPTTRYFVNTVFKDGSEIIVDDKLSHAEAMVSALEGGVPVVDLTR